MNRLSRMAAAARRGAARLLPTGRRDWVAAVWTEAHVVPPGLARLAWRAGGVWMIAREALMPRRLAGAALFAAAASAAAWAAWPQPPVGHELVSQVGVITTVLLLAGLPLLARRFFGPASAGAAGRFLRLVTGAAILGLLPALALVEVFANAAPRQPAYLNVFHTVQGSGGVPGVSSGGPPWSGEIVILLMTAGYVAVIAWMTSQRSLVTRATLVIGAAGGLTLGVVMYLVAPLGLGNDASDPWLPGSDVDPLVALAWILLLAGPLAVGAIAARRCRDPDGSVPPWQTKIRQGIAAGLLANVIGAVFVTALGTGTIALMLRSAALRHWLYHGQHWSALAMYRHELWTSQNTMGYVFICLAFPVIGLIMGAAVAGTMPVPREPDPPGPGPGGGPPAPAPAPDPPAGARVPALS